MTTPVQPLRASPLQIERHEFLDVEVHATESDESHTSLPLSINRILAQHDGDSLRWRLELTVRFGGDKDGKPSVYSGMLRIAGYFHVHEKFPPEKRCQLIEVTGASILYGACREMLANLTARGAHGVVSLPSISFVPPKTLSIEAIPEPRSRATKRAKVNKPLRK